MRTPSFTHIRNGLVAAVIAATALGSGATVASATTAAPQAPVVAVHTVAPAMVNVQLAKLIHPTATASAVAKAPTKVISTTPAVMARLDAGQVVHTSAGTIQQWRGIKVTDKDPSDTSHGGWAGEYKVVEPNGQVLFADCVSANKLLPGPEKFRLFPQGSKVGLEEAYISSHFTGANVSNETAAESYIALNKLVGYKPGVIAAREAALPKLVQHAVPAMLNNAALYYGSGKLIISLPKKPVIGGGTGIAKVALNGHPVSETVSLTYKGSVTGPKLVKSNVPFAFIQTGSGKFTVSGNANGGAVTNEVSLPPTGWQTLYAAGPGTRIKGSATGTEQVGTFTHKYNCPRGCTGIVQLTNTFCSAPGTVKTIFTTYADGKIVKVMTVTIPAVSAKAKHPVCVTSKLALESDGAKITATAQYFVNGHLTAPVGLTGSYVIVCPPWVSGGVSTDCQCNGKSDMSANFTAPSTKLAYSFVLLQNGVQIGVYGVGTHNVSIQAPSGVVERFDVNVVRGGKVVRTVFLGGAIAV